MSNIINIRTGKPRPTNKVDYSFEELTEASIHIIQNTWDSVYEDTATKESLLPALTELSTLMFLITRTTEEMVIVRAAVRDANDRTSEVEHD